MYEQENLFEVQQGEIIANDGHIHDLPCIVVKYDLGSKYAYVSDTGTNDDVPVVYLSAGTLTLYTDESKTGEPTVISFPNHVGWRIVSAGVSRYTLTVVLQQT